MDIAPLDFASIGKWLGTALVGIAAWTYTRLDGRVTKLEDESVTREDFKELRRDVRGLYEKVDAQSREQTKELIEALRR